MLAEIWMLAAGVGTVVPAVEPAVEPLLAQGGKPVEVRLWEGKAPRETREPAEPKDISKPNEGKVAGKPVIRLAPVVEPTVTVYLPPEEKATGAAVVICPGGGRQILAWDLEGTEVAEWLNSIGVAGIVLKYRVPAPAGEQPWQNAVGDAQRALSLARAKAGEWRINPDKIGILGFSAGGEVAALTSLATERMYPAADAVDKEPCVPNAALLIYPAYLVDKERKNLLPHVKPHAKAPPTFFVHAMDDPVVPESSALLALALRREKVPVEAHLFASGGHGYGLRPTAKPVTGWPKLAGPWLSQTFGPANQASK